MHLNDADFNRMNGCDCDAGVYAQDKLTYSIEIAKGGFMNVYNNKPPNIFRRMMMRLLLGWKVRIVEE